MQTFQSLLAERWLGSLKPMVLSNCSYLGETETGCYRHILPQGTCQGPQVSLAGAVTMQRPSKILFKSMLGWSMPSRVMGYNPYLWPKHFPQL